MLHEGSHAGELLKGDSLSMVVKIWCPQQKAHVVCKKLAASKRTDTEIAVLKSLDHPAIPKLLNASTSDGITSIVMEYRNGVTLESALLHRDFSEADARYIIKQLVNIINYLHNKKVVHRDLKPQNMIVDEFNNVSLIDFGFADFITENMTDRLGSPAFCAPELVRGDPYSELVDVWGIGVIAYLLMSGTLPFEAETIEDTFKSILTDDPVQPERFPKPVSVHFLNFVRAALSKDPANRPHTDELLKYPWLCSYPELKLAKFGLSGSANILYRHFIAKPRKRIIKPHYSTHAVSYL